MSCNTKEREQLDTSTNRELSDVEINRMKELLKSKSEELGKHRGYEEKDQRMYHRWVHGGNLTKEFSLVKEAHPSSFVTINHDLKIDLGKDYKNVYMGALKIEGADPITFEQERDYYWKDKNQVYLLQYGLQKLIVEGADPGTFEVLGNFNWSKDKDNVFFNFDKLSGCSPNNFEVLTENWGKDESYFYHKKHRLDSLDYSSAVIVSEYYIKDNQNVYFENKIVQSADPKTFVADGIGWFGHDDQNMFDRTKNNGEITEEYRKIYINKE